MDNKAGDTLLSFMTDCQTSTKETQVQISILPLSAIRYPQPNLPYRVIEKIKDRTDSLSSLKAAPYSHSLGHVSPSAKVTEYLPLVNGS